MVDVVSRSAAPGRRLKRISVLAGSVVVSLAVVEAALRIWILHLPTTFLVYLNPRLRDSSPAVTARLHDALPALNRRQADPDTGWTFTPNMSLTGKNEDGEPYAATTSPEGFFTPDLPSKTQRQLILLGDSFLSTYYVSRPMPNVIRDTLGVPTYNLAVGGWGPESYIAAYRKFANGRRHDLVVVCSFINDITDVDNWQRWKREQRSESFFMWIRRLTSQDAVNLGQSWADTHLVLWNVVRFTLKRPVRSAEPPLKPAARQVGRSSDVRLVALTPHGPTLEHYRGFDLQFSPGYSFMVHDPEDFLPGGDYYDYIAAYLQSLLRLKAAIEMNHARMVLVWIPSPERVYLPLLESRRQAAYVTNSTRDVGGLEGVLHRFATSAGLDFLDLVGPLTARARAGEKLYFTRDGHLNSYGNQVAGELVADFMRRLPANPLQPKRGTLQLLKPGELAVERPLSTSAMLRPAQSVRAGGDSWTAQGKGEARYSYLATWPEVSIQEPQRLIVRGVLRRGGFTVGLLKNDRWAVARNITTPGRFDLMIVVRESGRYVPVFANCLPADSLENDFEITSFGLATHAALGEQ